MVNNKEFSASNAVPTTFGFEFQALAGLILILENLKEVNRFSIEGPNEDVELELNNGKYIYAQVKAKETDTLDKSSNLGKLKAGLKTLNEDCKDGDAEKLVYISNTYFPLGTSKKYEALWPYSSTKSKYSFKDINSLLPKSLEQILDSYSDKNSQFNRELLEIYFYKFLNVEDKYTKYEVFYQEIERYISNINKSHGKYYEEVFNRWYTLIRQSESSRQDYSKESFLWQLIELFNDKIDNDPFLDYLDLEEYELNEICQTYFPVIRNIEGSFELSNRVLAKYSEMRQNNELGEIRDQRRFVFIDKTWNDFREEIFLSENKDDEEIVVKYALWRLITNNKLIKKVKESGNI
ncbi:dsDNA nuclease domain-containing protein [Streptococcus equinus]|uniref:dsDNA nuclease domain-containing protein n=1 Tax=Streptococcus equinus TaxID=1335 RepID=UPI003EEA8FD3